jgi:U3 small nucleolar RNA-associated protein 12
MSYNWFSFVTVSALTLWHGRSDVRAACVTSDGLQIATCSAEGMKVWNTKTYSCVVSCPTDYGVSMSFVTGNRYVIVGSKEGKLQVRRESTHNILPMLSGHIHLLCGPDARD